MPTDPTSLVHGQFRFTGFGPRVLRIVRRGKNGFNDRPSLFVPNLPLLTPSPIEHRIDGGMLLVDSHGYEVRMDLEAKTLAGVSVYKIEGEAATPILTIGKEDLKNTGELPLPEHTPEVYVLSDSPRLSLPRHGYVEDGKPNSSFLLDEDAEDVYLIFAERDPYVLRKVLISLTGVAPIMPLSAFGSWDSKYYEYNDATVDEEIANYAKYGLPLDNFVIDTDWRAAGATVGAGYKPNTKDFPSLRKTFERLHKKNLTVMFNDHPEPVKGADNLFDPKEVAFRRKNLTHFLSLGLDYWWFDRNWITRLKSIEPGAHPTLTPETLGAYLYHDVTRNYLETSAKGEYPKRTLLMSNVDEITNGVYKGITNIASHRYGIQWTGDTTMSDEFIGYEIENLVRAGANLIPYCHGDITGHVGDGSDELYVHYMQLGVFSPIYRLHSTHDVKRFRQPWLWGKRVLDIARDYDLLRYRLLPYYYSAARVAYETGTPIARALGFIKGESTRFDEAKIGDGLLFAPIYTPVSKMALPKQAFVSKIKASYYNNESLQGKPVYEAEYEGAIDFDWGTHSPKDGVVEREHFSAAFEFDLTNPLQEPMNLLIGSDDGIRLYEDGKLVIDSWVNRGFYVDRGPKLGVGETHHYRLEYYQGVMGAKLVAYMLPESEEPKKEKDTYIPLDGEYIDLFDGSVHAPGSIASREYGLEECPLFVRTGTIIPLAKECLNTHDSDWSTLSLAMFPRRDGSAHFTLYEDDRETEAYMHGEWRKTRFSGTYVEDKRSYELTIDESAGSYDGAKQEREYRFQLYLRKDEVLKAIRCDGEVLPFDLVKHSGTGMPLPFEGPARALDYYDCSVKLSNGKSHLVEFFIE